MTDANFEREQEISDPSSDSADVVDLLHHPLSPQNEDDSDVQKGEQQASKGEVMPASSQDLRPMGDSPPASGSDQEVEDLEVQEEESVTDVPNLDHLKPVVVSTPLQEMVDGKLQGVVESHDQEGKLVSYHHYEDGLLDGESRKYDANQKLKDRINYKGGVPHGPAEFYRDGRALMHAQYNNGELHGETSYFDPNSGMITARVTHQNGKKNGTSMTYDALGKVKRLLHYNEDEIEGPAFSYHTDGSVQQEGYYLGGRKHGQFTSYYRNGEIRQVEFYENGRLTRRPILFTPDGEEYEPRY